MLKYVLMKKWNGCGHILKTGKVLLQATPSLKNKAAQPGFDDKNKALNRELAGISFFPSRSFL